MSLSFEEVERVFPEAQQTFSRDHTEFTVHCPRFHKKGGRYKMSINADTGAYICHDCGHAGNAYKDFFDEGRQFFIGMKVRRPKDSETSCQVYRSNRTIWKDDIPVPGEMVKMSSLEDNHPAVEYLTQRGISMEDADRFKLSYCTDGTYRFSDNMGTTSGRIIFPVVMAGTLMGWQARQVEKVNDRGDRMIWKGDAFGWDIMEKIPLEGGGFHWSDHHVPKYYTCPGMQRARSLFNFDKAVKNEGYVVVTEGPIDALKVGCCSVATFGKKLTRDQIRIICTNWTKIIMILDQDVNTQDEWFKRLEDSFKGVYLLTMKLEGFKDPGEAPRSEIWKQIEAKYGNPNDYRPKVP